MKSFSRQSLQTFEINFVAAIKLDVFLWKIFADAADEFDGEKKLAATAAWLAEPPSSRGFSAFGVLMESSAVVPMIKTLMEISGYGLQMGYSFSSLQRGTIFCGTPRWSSTRATTVSTSSTIDFAPA